MHECGATGVARIYREVLYQRRDGDSCGDYVACGGSGVSVVRWDSNCGHGFAARNRGYANANAVPFFGVLVDGAAVGNVFVLREALGGAGIVGGAELVIDLDWDFVADFLEAESAEIGRGTDSCTGCSVKKGRKTYRRDAEKAESALRDAGLLWFGFLF